MNQEFRNFKKYLTSIVPMDDKVFDFCLDFLEIKHIKKGDHLVRAGRVCNEMAFINQGIFRIYYLKEGIEVNTCFCQENSIVSSFQSFTNKTVSRDFIEAIEDASIVSLSHTNLMTLYKADQKWQDVGRVLVEKECIRLSERVNTLSFETALEKYNHLLSNQPDIVQRVPVQYIATYIGVSRETLSRIRSKIS